MPSATPIPRGPGHLVLFGADDLLVAGACPVCRYAAEADDRFLGWFALEGHAQPDTITRLCASLGMCPAHTRALLCQPGADGRLTAVYRYLLQAALAHLAGRTSPNAPCPACSAGTGAASRAADTITAALRDDEAFGDRYRAAGGLCLPHLRLAAAHGPRRTVAWLAADAQARLGAGRPPLAAVAGERDADADIRLRLRAALAAAAAPALNPAPGTVSGVGTDEVCAICLAAAAAERDALDQVPAAARDRAHDGPWPGLCPAHLHDAWSDSGGPRAGAGQLLALQAEQATAWLSGHAGRWRRPGRPYRGPGSACSACAVCHGAADAAAGRLLRLLRESGPASAGSGRAAAAGSGPAAPWLCLRHVLSLRQHDPEAAGAVAKAAARVAAALVAELEEAFRQRSRVRGPEAPGPEMTAWRRAAGLIDGRVYGGGPPRPLAAGYRG
jgi:hypothetical protein